MQNFRRLPVAVLAVLCLLASPPGPYTYGQQPDLRDYDTVWSYSPPQSLEQWQRRAKDLKLQIQVSLGLYPQPILDPVEPEIYGKLDFGDYTIEKVTFESLPGFYVTGNLYKPNQDGLRQAPGILCPHGHWTEARFYEASDQETKQLLATGAERFESAARNHIQARCVQLARMGCIVFHWDMIGYCDSQQISFDRAHRYGVGGNLNPEDDDWLLFSAEAESRLQNVLGMQALATQRAVDMLLTLPEIDPSRIAITGASGGGTQSFIGAALDERIQVAFPAVMVSTGMQGGCTCENACFLRHETVNVEIAALIAPRPLGMTAADDWTRTMPEDGFPQLQEIYELYGARQQTALFPALHFGHNFNHVSRVSMYGWMSKHLNLGLEQPVLETSFQRAAREQLTVWDQDHPQPEGGVPFERQLLELWHSISEGQLLGLAKGDRQQRAQAKEILRNGWRVCLGGSRNNSQESVLKVDASDKTSVLMHSLDLGQWRVLTTRPATSESTAAVPPASDQTSHAYALQVPTTRSQKDLQIIASDAGSEAAIEYYPLLEGKVTTEQKGKSGTPVLLKIAKQRLVSNPRPAAAYTFGYNLPLFATQAQQLASTMRWIGEQHPGQQLQIKAQGGEAAMVLAASLLLQTEGHGLENWQMNLDLSGFRFGQVTDIRDPHFLPGSVKYLDIPGLLASLQPGPDLQLLANESPTNAEWFSQLMEFSLSPDEN